MLFMMMIDQRRTNLTRRFTRPTMLTINVDVTDIYEISLPFENKH